MNHRLTPTITAAAMIAATALTATGISALGEVFHYPEVLKEPAADILASFRESSGPVAAWFTALAVGAALMIPIALGVGRLSRTRLMRIAIPVGIAAAVVQMVGLLRWPLLVPGFAADASSTDPAVVAAAEDSFRTAHRLLGNVIGETFGYLFTSVWTLLVVLALRTSFAGLWFTVLGAASAALIVTGVLSPLDLPFVDLANLIGYFLWAGWMVAFAVLLIIKARRSARPVVTTSALVSAS